VLLKLVRHHSPLTMDGVADSRQLQARLHLREGGGGFLCQFVSHPWSMGNRPCTFLGRIRRDIPSLALSSVHQLRETGKYMPHTASPGRWRRFLMPVCVPSMVNGEWCLTSFNSTSMPRVSDRALFWGEYGGTYQVLPSRACTS
jgi:hypothetical protein